MLEVRIPTPEPLGSLTLLIRTTATGTVVTQECESTRLEVSFKVSSEITSKRPCKLWWRVLENWLAVHHGHWWSELQTMELSDKSSPSVVFRTITHGVWLLAEWLLLVTTASDSLNARLLGSSKDRKATKTTALKHQHYWLRRKALLRVLVLVWLLLPLVVFQFTSYTIVIAVTPFGMS